MIQNKLKALSEFKDTLTNTMTSYGGIKTKFERPSTLK